MIRTTLEYEGCRGTAAYSEDDRVYRGEVLVTSHVMRFEVGDADEMKPALRDAVDGYVGS